KRSLRNRVPIQSGQLRDSESCASSLRAVRMFKESPRDRRNSRDQRAAHQKQYFPRHSKRSPNHDAKRQGQVCRIEDGWNKSQRGWGPQPHRAVAKPICSGEKYIRTEQQGRLEQAKRHDVASETFCLTTAGLPSVRRSTTRPTYPAAKTSPKTRRNT